MTVEQQIRINQLLLERERWFVRIHELESAAAELLGEPYPFTRDMLPSELKPRKKSGVGGATAKAANGRDAVAVAVAAAEKVRRLEDGETGYRVVYRQAGRAVEEFHEDTTAIRRLMTVAGAGGRVQVLRVETVVGDGAAGAVLWAAPEGS